MISHRIGVTFPLFAPNGSLAAPSYSFTSSTGTGFFWDGTFLRSGIAGVGAVKFNTSSFGPIASDLTTLGDSTGGAAGNWHGLYLNYTNTGTVGAVTINKPSGRVNIAAGGTSVVVTNSLVTAASHVLVVMSTADATGRVTSVVPAAGSFTINTVAVTAQASFDFVIISSD